MHDEHAVDVRGLAEILGVSVSTVYGFASRREIPAVKVGNRWRFWPSEVRTHLEQQRAETDPWRRSPQSRAAILREARKRVREGRADEHDRLVVSRHLRGR